MGRDYDGNWPYGHPDGTAADHANHAAQEARTKAEDNAKRIDVLETRVMALEQLMKRLLNRQL